MPNRQRQRNKPDWMHQGWSPRHLVASSPISDATRNPVSSRLMTRLLRLGRDEIEQSLWSITAWRQPWFASTVLWVCKSRTGKLYPWLYRPLRRNIGFLGVRTEQEWPIMAIVSQAPPKRLSPCDEQCSANLAPTPESQHDTKAQAEEVRLSLTWPRQQHKSNLAQTSPRLLHYIEISACTYVSPKTG